MTFNKGDQVYTYDHYRIARTIVERVTKAQAITSAGGRYNRETGRMVGAGSWGASYISHPTPGLDKQYQEQTIRAGALVLSKAAGKGDPEEIRAAYAGWERALEATK